MPRGRGNSSSRRGRSRRRSSGHIADEYLTFACNLGSTQKFTIANISTRPKSTNFRPIFACLECTMPVSLAMANGDFAPSLIPGGVDIQLFDPSGKTVATSRPRTLSALTSRVFVRYPRSGDWFAYDVSAAVPLGQFSALCFGTTGATTIGQSLRGLLHIRYAFSFEILTAVCSYQHLGPLNWAEEVDREIPLVEADRQSSCPSICLDFSFLDIQEPFQLP